MKVNALLASEIDRLGGLSLDLRPRISGRLAAFDGMILEASGLSVPVGTLCSVETSSGGTLSAEVIGFRGPRCVLMMLAGDTDLVPSARVTPVGNQSHADVGPELLGRVIDGAGEPLDGLGPVHASARGPLAGRPQNPLCRSSIEEPIDVGVRGINGLLTMGRGQRVGVIAGSGVGKSVLLGMMVKQAVADVVVVGLIGERSREVTDFLATKLAGPAMERACVVAVPANQSPILRLRGAMRATAIAEYFRAQGKSVLLIMDSLTRVAHAQREIGLSLGEAPTSKGYPPSVFGLLPRLIERCGNDADTGGSITAIYTVLADGDDTTSDPVVDSARAILDGHIVLSRAQAERGIYPAIDIGASISRVMSDIVPLEHLNAARALKRMHSLYEDNRDLVLMGAYQRGHDTALDEAIERQPDILRFISQAERETVDFDQSVAALLEGFGA